MKSVFPRFSVALMVAIMIVSSIGLVLGENPAQAQEGIDPAAVITVPYRLPTVSGEDLEMRLQFRNRYKEVVGTSFDITVPKPDGNSSLELVSTNGSKIILTLTIKDNVVLSTKVDTDARPATGANTVTLAISSRSGESIYVIFQFSGSSVTSVAYNSSRTGFTP